MYAYIRATIMAKIFTQMSSFIKKSMCKYAYMYVLFTYL